MRIRVLPLERADLNNILNLRKIILRVRLSAWSKITVPPDYLECANAVVAKNNFRLGKIYGAKRKRWTYKDISDRKRDRWGRRMVISSNRSSKTADLFEWTGDSLRTNASPGRWRTITESRYTIYHCRRIKFYERKEIKDILAYLKVLVNPRDSMSLQRIINFPSRESTGSWKFWLIMHLKCSYPCMMPCPDWRRWVIWSQVFLNQLKNSIRPWSFIETNWLIECLPDQWSDH